MCLGGIREDSASVCLGGILEDSASECYKSIQFVMYPFGKIRLGGFIYAESPCSQHTEGPQL